MITIIITAYNVAETIGKTIESCIGQTYKDLEILIINDCSTDNTVEVIESFKDDRIRLLHNEVNVGAGMTRRRATNEAKGEYTLFLDGDDWLENDCIEKLYSLAVEHNADIVSFGLNVVDENYNITGTLTQKFKVLEGDEQLKISKEPNGNLMKVFLNNKLVRRSIWDNVVYSGRRFIEDTQTCYFVINESKKMVETDYVGFNYYQRSSSLCHQNGELKAAIYRALCAKDICVYDMEKYPDRFKNSLGAFIMRLKEIKKLKKLDDEDGKTYEKEFVELCGFIINNI